MRVEYLVVHTAAFRGRNCDAGMIDRWHRERGWKGIGYHYVILNNRHDSKADGAVEGGRPTHVNGAHVEGLNSKSLGICVVGDGDTEPFTDRQMASLLNLLRRLQKKYGVPAERVIGHREVNKLVDAGKVAKRYRTAKSCPGKRVDMDWIRKQLAT